MLLGNCSVEDGKLELQEIDCSLIFSGIRLQYPRHEAMWKVEATEPVGLRVTFGHPSANEADSLSEVGKPDGQVLIGGVGYRLPVGRHLVLQEARVHLIKSWAHDLQSLDCSDEAAEGAIDLHQEPIVAFLLLEQHDAVAME